MIKLIGRSTKFEEMLRTVDIVATLNVPVFLSGKVGTGKETIAQYMHEKSNYDELIKINCSKLDDDVLQSTLKSSSATVFLNDISELSHKAQESLLNFIEHSDTAKSNIRVIASSKNDMVEQIDQGNFREDLFYRLNVVPIDLPALHEREEDILLLIESIFSELVQEYRKTAPSFSKAALRKITEYPWPGNIRELRNFCERMIILFNGKELDITNLPSELLSSKHASTSESFFNLPTSGIDLQNVEADFIRQALRNTHGNKSKAASLLGLSRDTFLYRLKKHQV